MDASAIDTQIAHYQTKLLQLDRYAAQLDAADHQTYQAKRKKFLHRLTTWQQSLHRDIAACEHNLEEGYQALEAAALSNTN